MSRLTIVGVQWGDEGKGKMTDYLAQKSDVVVRYQGGNNAGHTITFGGQRYALQSIPSGIFSPKIKNVMANGMVINPKAVLDELQKLREMGITDYQLFISDRASVVMPYHIELDGAYESLKKGSVIGTTNKGIGPAYADKYNRTGIRIGDLLHKEYLRERLDDAISMVNIQMRVLRRKRYNLHTLCEEYAEYGRLLSPYICDTSRLLYDEVKKDSRILFEGAQGVMLCIEHGTYPFVTSSSPATISVPLGTGIPPKYIDHSLGICKAYNTRVGSGVFPTEITNSTAYYIRDRGNEYGTVTGRPRRIGFLDTVALRHACRISGIDSLAVMLFDVLSGISELKICTHYELNNKTIDYIPSTIYEYEKCKPIYMNMPVWSEDISACRSFDELPENAKYYLKKIEELTDTPISYVSVGPDREQTIEVKKLNL